MRRPFRKAAFTLIETKLVVIAIIAILPSRPAG